MNRKKIMYLLDFIATIPSFKKNKYPSVFFLQMYVS